MLVPDSLHLIRLLEVLPEIMQIIVRGVVLGTSAFSFRAVTLGTGEAVRRVGAVRGKLTPSLRIASLLLSVPLGLPFFFPPSLTESIMDTLK